MMSITHAAIALAATSISLGISDPTTLALAVVGSQLPDLDTTESLAGRVVFPIAWAIEKRFPHRTITHSFLSTGIVGILAAPLWGLGWRYWAAVVIGQFVGWFADSFTRAGVTAFYPNPARLVIPGNPKARLRSGSQLEYWVLGIALFLAIAVVNLNSSGGISEQFSRLLFNDPATAGVLFGKYGSDRLIYIDVQGMNVATSQPVAERFVMLEASGNTLIAESRENGRLYKIGNAPDVQIQPHSVKAEVGAAVKISSRESDPNDIGVLDWLQGMPQDAYLSGSLLLDEMGEVRITPAIESYPTVRVFGGQLELSNARPEQLGALRDFWILQGKVIVKVRR